MSIGEAHFTYGGFGFTTKAQRTSAGWRYSVRAQTVRPWQEVADEVWPSEVYTAVDHRAGLAVLVCHAAIQAPPEVGLVEALAPRLRLEGPIGEQAAAALEACEANDGVECVDGLGNRTPGPCPERRRRPLVIATGVALLLAGVLVTRYAALAGGWTRLGIIAAELALGSAWAVRALDVEYLHPTAAERPTRPFRGG